MLLAVGNTVDPKTGDARPVPWAYTQLRLCRDVYHCTPSELDAEDWETVSLHIEILNLEEQYRPTPE